MNENTTPAQDFDAVRATRTLVTRVCGGSIEKAVEIIKQTRAERGARGTLTPRQLIQFDEMLEVLQHEDYAGLRRAWI